MTSFFPRALSALMIFGLLCSALQAGVEIREFETEQQRRQYQHLVEELRCLVCQNQNLADSNAQLARDLRSIIYEKIREGNDDRMIVDYLVARYGKFVLYDPPLDRTTFLLWSGPVILLLIGLFLLIRFIVIRARTPVPELSEDQQRRAQTLLGRTEDES